MNMKENELPKINPMKNYENIMKSPSLLSPTSRVIDSLHSEIDILKSELETNKQKQEEDKSKSFSLKKKYDQVIDQLANYKHENDMINALLERKQRRISDLEEKLNESMTSTEDYKFNLNNLEVRCRTLQEREKVATSEFERMKIAYETVVTSQKEYREYYNKEIAELKDKLAQYVSTRGDQLQDLSKKFEANSANVQQEVQNNSKLVSDLQSVYAEKNTKLLETLKNLAVAAKSHGQDTQLIINQCNLVFKEIKNRFGLDVNKLAEHYKEAEVDSIEKVLGIESALENVEVTSPILGMGRNNTNVRNNNKTIGSRVSSANTSNNSISNQENLDPKKREKRNSVAPAESASRKASGNRNSRRVSLADFSEFEKKKPKQKRVSSIKTDLVNNDNNAESDNEIDNDAENDGATESTDGDKKKKNRRRRKRKSHRVDPEKEGVKDDKEELDEITGMISEI